MPRADLPVTRGRLIALTAMTAGIASLLSLVAWIALLASSIGSSCPQPDDPTCHSHDGALDILGSGLLLAAIGVAILSVAIAAAWGRPTLSYRWHVLFALLMAPMPTLCGLVYLLLYRPTGALLATIASAGMVAVWMTGWAQVARWASENSIAHH